MIMTARDSLKWGMITAVISLLAVAVCIYFNLDRLVALPFAMLPPYFYGRYSQTSSYDKIIREFENP